MSQPSSSTLRSLSKLIRQPRLPRPPQLLSKQIAHLRWQAPLLALLLVLTHQIIEHIWFSDADAFNIMGEIAVYGLGGPALLWLALGWIKHKVALKEAAEAELFEAHSQLTRLNQHISFLLKISQRLSEAANEEDLASLLLQLPGEITASVVGSSLIRFDDHHQPMPIAYQGALDEASLTAWHQHLSSQPVRLRCGACQVRAAEAGQPCPLFKRLPLEDVGRIVCLPLERNGHQFAILGLFLGVNQTLSEAERDLLEALAAEISIALENTRLRTRELAAFYEVNESLQLRLGFERLMSRVLTRTMEAAGAEAGLLLLQEADGSLAPQATAGDWSGIGRLTLVEGLVSGALRESSGEPLIVALPAPASEANTTSVLCAPMIADDGPLGAIILGSRRRDAFVRQQMRLVSAIAGQAALLTQNARLYAKLEHQAILAERGRLAREMHDGLAQTLGYLKMRAGQIARWVDAGQSDQASEALRELGRSANDAYLDLRAALDGLRLSLDAQQDNDFGARLQRCAANFENQTGLNVSLTLDSQAALSLSAPAQSHLLRIVQETLTNIRKHANATHVTLRFTTQNNHARVLIEDNGQGFDAGRDMPDTRHGLRLMRERADLLGAELQVYSTPGEGTRVCLEWPAS
jgi:two-component system nitrate/nitrite sensor histidine kinase NarX